MLCATTVIKDFVSFIQEARCYNAVRGFLGEFNEVYEAHSQLGMKSMRFKKASNTEAS